MDSLTAVQEDVVAHLVSEHGVPLEEAAQRVRKLHQQDPEAMTGVTSTPEAAKAALRVKVGR